MIDDRLVTVFATNNRISVLMAESLLKDASIKYFVRGEDLQNLLNYGVAIGPIEIQVAEEDAEDARKILEELEK